MFKYYCLIALVFLITIFVLFFKNESNIKVTNEAQAIEIAKKSWINIYEKSQHSIFSTVEIQRFEPYKAILKNNKWVVTGTVPNNFVGELVITEITLDGKTSASTVPIK